ncbi:MAG: hypothetical protein FVQ83_05235 [Chloroflexi bacterium]|nr:hypothetical protein [Chloroflexota bacterium]
MAQDDRLGMNFLWRIQMALKALRELGLQPLLLFAYHNLRLRSGILERSLPVGKQINASGKGFTPVITSIEFPKKEALIAVLGQKANTLFGEADEILDGKVRLFGGMPRTLRLTAPEPLKHWTEYKAEKIAGQDIKWTWEPGRFTWAITLARAYHLSGEEKYAQAFWYYLERFLEANPPNLGPHWISAQEVALRLVSMSFAFSIFQKADSSNPGRTALLGRALAVHAERIPPTLEYSRAQNNNHLLTEAAGLYTAGVVLPDHPEAQQWRELGWNWFNQGIQNQIASDGAYVQNSSNYLRLMLQTALWVVMLARNQGQEIPLKTRLKLGLATRWLQALLDEQTGRVPNLGPNDGAYILPLSVHTFNDYLPVLQAVNMAFLEVRPFGPGSWDEMSLWFGLTPSDFPLALPESERQTGKLSTPLVMRNPGGKSWAYIRAAKFSDRPGHADQLHFDLWWRGLNVAQDPGTYLYNEAPPWNNALSSTEVHNTIMVERRDQMTRAGNFLWLDWAQAKVIEARREMNGALTRLIAQHDGYRRLGVTHKRTVEHKTEETWLITDDLLGQGHGSIYARLHWLLPDWPWELRGTTLQIKSPFGWVYLHVDIGNPEVSNLQVIRAGELLFGGGSASPVQGWAAPTYAHKVPRLSFAVEFKDKLPIQIKSEWEFPK